MGFELRKEVDNKVYRVETKEGILIKPYLTIEEMQNIVAETSYSLRVYYLDEDRNEVEEAVRLCRERKPLGVMFLGGNPQYFEAEFSAVTVPSVLVTNQGDMLGFDNLSSIATDDVAASEKAMDYLLAQGHRNIGVIGGDRFVLSNRPLTYIR